MRGQVDLWKQDVRTKGDCGMSDDTNPTHGLTHEACEPFRRAQQSGTDNEGYGRLISDTWGDWIMGCGLPLIVFCPWCGTKL